MFGAARHPALTATDFARAFGDVLTLRHLHGSGADCTSAEEQRAPLRRWFHHCTFYGFLLCFASTSVAALYHIVFGWLAPYPYGSLPVLLGMAGGAGLLVGPAGLLMLREQRDPALSDPGQRGLDQSFIALLFLTSLTGFLLLAFRERAVMSAVLVVHLGAVLALFRHASLREVRPRHLSNGSAHPLRDGEPAHRRPPTSLTFPIRSRNGARMRGHGRCDS